MVHQNTVLIENTFFEVIEVFDRLFIDGKEKINQLEGYKNVTVGRELRIIGLKKKIKELEEKL